MTVFGEQMNIVLAIVILVGGLVILWKCAELLVAGASWSRSKRYAVRYL